MFIDTRSHESMENDCVSILGITVEELYFQLVKADQFAFEPPYSYNLNKFFDCADNLLPNGLAYPDEVVFYHLTRRLNVANVDESFNLHKLLLGTNSISDYLSSKGISFCETENGLDMIRFGKRCPLEDERLPGVKYLKVRLGYYENTDYCVNGFALKDFICGNGYARILFNAPEIIVNISQYFQDPSIVEDFKNNSRYYCFAYRVPISAFEFVGEKKTNKEKAKLLMLYIFKRLLVLHQGDENDRDEDNPILFLKEELCLQPDRFLGKEEITLQMLQGRC